MNPFVTEIWLRENFGLDPGSEITLPENSRLTPSARSLIGERKITVNHINDAGEVPAAACPAGDKSGQSFRRTPKQTPDKTILKDRENKRVNPLTGAGKWSKPSCLMCRQVVSEKPDTLTHLNMDTLVPKNDPRLKLRGRLDALIAQTVLIQEEYDPQSRYPELACWLKDIRAALGNVLKAEAKGGAVEPMAMGAMDEKTIHAVSHNPLRYIGMDHLLPEVGHGLQTARLNLLRARIREAELLAADIYIARDFTVTRPDIMEGLNRLSSAVYVLMMLTHLAERGKPVALERIKA
jgi:ethanolamine utilization cobalamin adenosyltransferase